MSQLKMSVKETRTAVSTESDLTEAKCAMFKALTGCACLLCHCKDYEKVVLRKSEVVKRPNGGFAVKKKAWKRERSARRWAIIDVTKVLKNK